MKYWWIGLIIGCGGGSAAAPSAESASGPRVELPTSRQHNTVVPLEAGELLLGADATDAATFHYAIRAREGQLVLFACDRMNAETGESGFALGEVEYAEDGDSEVLVGMVERAKIERLASEPLPRIQTCEEELELGVHQVTLLRAFLEGRPPEHLELSSISVVGLDMSFAISEREPDQVRLELVVDLHAIEQARQAAEAEREDSDESEELPPLREPRVGDRCPLKAVVRDHPIDMATVEYVASQRHHPAHYNARVPRTLVQLLAREPSIRLDVCGAQAALDSVVLGSLKAFVGDPPAGESLPEPPPGEEQDEPQPRRGRHRRHGRRRHQSMR